MTPKTGYHPSSGAILGDYWTFMTDQNRISYHDCDEVGESDGIAISKNVQNLGAFQRNMERSELEVWERYRGKGNGQDTR